MRLVPGELVSRFLSSVRTTYFIMIRCPDTYLDARDTFVGMYSVQILQQKHRGEWNIEKAIDYACKASARTIGKLGAQESIPWLNEIDVEDIS